VLYIAAVAEIHMPSKEMVALLNFHILEDYTLLTSANFITFPLLKKCKTQIYACTATDNALQSRFGGIPYE
jgi:hypothetical protein